jgi:hypothetical protein
MRPRRLVGQKRDMGTVKVALVTGGTAGIQGAVNHQMVSAHEEPTSCTDDRAVS